MPDAALDAAFRATVYEAETPAGTRIAIRVGACSPALDDLLAAAGADAWAFVTACNPRSTRLDPPANAARTARLEAAVAGRGLGALRGVGRGDSPGWPPEESLLVLGIAEADALELAREFDQHAIVVGTRGTAARLAWTTEAGDLTRG